MYENIPMELRQLQQWVCWRYEDRNGMPTKVPYSPDGLHHASIHNPATWGTFEQAVAGARSLTMSGIGMVLTDADPYTGIDIDDKQTNPASESELKAQYKILEAFQSYTERSVGQVWTDEQGRQRGGYHIIIRGRIKGGRDRGHVGVYSSERYLTFTGDVVRAAPIAEYQQYLDALVAEMPEGGYHIDLEDVGSHLTDKELHEMAMRAANGAKYDELCRGDWAAMGYPSQSEADFALMSIIAYYTRDNDQCRRLFRYSGLGRREKATQDNKHLDRMLKKIRAKEPAQVDFDALARDAANIIASHQARESSTDPELDEAPAEETDAALPVPATRPVLQDSGYSLPPGLVGQVAQYIYSSAVRPSQEVALLYAIGFLAGLVGRSYNISSTGLNVYLLLVAVTGVGKEDGPKGVERLMAAIRPSVPAADDYIGPGAFASGQALIRVLDARPCFVSMLGEFGLTLQQLNDPRAPAAVVMLRKVLLDLYSKSGWTNVLRSTAYSDSEKNTKTIHAPSVSFVGDTTPETFYDGLSMADIADGLIPRLHILEAPDVRPKRNRQAGHAPPAELINKLGDLVAMAITMANNNANAAVQLTAEAQAELDGFDEECDAHMRNAFSTGQKQLWNRAHLKALKLAGLLAVGCNPHAPAVTLELAQWAIAFTRAGTGAVLGRFERGDVGSGDAKQLSDLRKLVGDYFAYDAKTLKGYKVKPELQKAGVVPYSYLVVRATQMASFYKDRRGATNALKSALDTTVQTEVLAQVPAPQALSKFSSRAALYYRGERW
jgi:hypothetical protein